MPPDNTILMGAGVAFLGIVGLWMVKTLMSLRDEVRDLRIAVSNPDNGIIALLKHLVARVDTLERRYDVRFGVDG